VHPLHYHPILTSPTDKAFRHGDIENILETLSKSVKGHHLALGGGSLLGMAGQLLKHAAGSSKFSKSDVKKVYFVSICAFRMKRSSLHCCRAIGLGIIRR